MYAEALEASPELATEVIPLLQQIAEQLYTLEVWLASMTALLLAAAMAYFALRWWLTK